MSCGNQSTYNRVANAGNLYRLSPYQMLLGILHNLTGQISLPFPLEKSHFITAFYAEQVYNCLIYFFFVYIGICLSIFVNIITVEIWHKQFRKIGDPQKTALMCRGRNRKSFLVIFGKGIESDSDCLFFIILRKDWISRNRSHQSRNPLLAVN